MKVYELKLYAYIGEDQSGGFIDMWLDVETITGFYIPVRTEDNTEGEAINILHDGDMATILQENHIMEYLNERFVQVSVEDVIANG